jgi:NADH:ubiquinone oxidoreductase subunit K
MTNVLDGAGWILIASLALFWIGLLGLFWRRSLVGLLVGLGFAWASVSGLALAAGLLQVDAGRAVGAGALAVCAAIVGCLQLAVGLGVVFARVGRRGSIDVEEARLLEG